MISIGMDRLLAEFDQTRIICFTGSLGSGKTLLGHIIAEQYLKQGYRFLTNIKSVWADDARDIRPDQFGQRRAVILLDEGGRYVRTAKTAGSLANFARKLDTYLIFSGKKLPHEELQEITVQLYFDFQKWFLLPIKIYRYEVEAGKKNYGGLVWISGWWEYYGVYSTIDPGAYPQEILETIKGWTQFQFDLFGREYKLQDLETGENEGQEISNEFREAVKAIPVQKRTGKRK